MSFQEGKKLKPEVEYTLNILSQYYLRKKTALLTCSKSLLKHLLKLCELRLSVIFCQ